MWMVTASLGITIHAERHIADLKIVWQGGASTELSPTMNNSSGRVQVTDEDAIALVRRLAQHYNDRSIAVVLAKRKRRIATGLTWARARVAILRATHHIPTCQQPPKAAVNAGCDDALVVTIAEAEKALGVSKVTLYRWMKDGFIRGEQLTPGAPGASGSTRPSATRSSRRSPPT
ncbi:hypothetical protein [Streptomyces sp. NPDC056661]|uniref:hypothetical protein n=1 Tax=Streptomyces sp. NPDC056661 TaxID=3345898 RepID=UPI0036892D77